MFWIISGGLAVAGAVSFVISFVFWASKLRAKENVLVSLLSLVIYLTGPVIGVMGLLALAAHLELEPVLQIMLVIPAVFVPFFAGAFGSLYGEMWRTRRKN